MANVRRVSEDLEIEALVEEAFADPSRTMSDMEHTHLAKKVEEDCLRYHGLTWAELDKAIDNIRADMRRRGVQEERHQIGNAEVLIVES